MVSNGFERDRRTAGQKLGLQFQERVGDCLRKEDRDVDREEVGEEGLLPVLVVE